MASVTSLGMHCPTGLQHALDELILPPDPSPDLYKWSVSCNSDSESSSSAHASSAGQDELLITKNCVIWSRGAVFRKAYRFDVEAEPVSDAVLTFFPTSADDHPRAKNGNNDDSYASRNDSHGPRGPLAKALVVFLKTQAHIFFLSGSTHVVHLPFEVESACAAPCGLIMQRKIRKESSTAMPLKFPRAPPNSFLSSQVSPPRVMSSGLAFSTASLGKPKILPLRTSATLQGMWDPPIERPDSNWPRLVCLTDPLLELGLVVASTDADKRSRHAIRPAPFLHPAEEILHIEEIKQDTSTPFEQLIVAVTVNRETNMYTVWRLTYIENPDRFLHRRGNMTKANINRRRSSMQPGLPSGATTPLLATFRESLGTTLTVKKTRKSTAKDDKSLEQVLSLEEEKAGEVTRRQSRRVSSHLARADLSASHERPVFDQPSAAAAAGRRVDSHGSHRARTSGGYAPGNTSATYNQTLHSLLEAPVDDFLHELNHGGDFGMFSSMGLEDNNMDGLTREMIFTKLHSVPMDNANIRYSLSDAPAREQSKVFTVLGTPFAVDALNRNVLLVCIQDRVDKRLQLLTFYVHHHPLVEDAPTTRQAKSGDTSISYSKLTRAQSVVDSCRILDGDQSMILLLSDGEFGERHLSIQAPLSGLTNITVPLFFADNLNSLDYKGSHVNKETKGRRSVRDAVSTSHLTGLGHAHADGTFDIRDSHGTSHRLKVQLQPHNAQVRRTLDACRAVLPAQNAEKMLVGWWHAMQWMATQDDGPVADMEWSSLTIEILVLFLALGDTRHASSDSISRARSRPKSRGAHSTTQAGNSWDVMQAQSAPHGSGFPPWMQCNGWQWLLDEGAVDMRDANDGGDTHQPVDFLTRHVRLARLYMASPQGLQAVGPAGYLPTAASATSDSSIAAARNIMIALHLLLEEHKLNIMLPEHTSPGPGDLRAILCQVARWLRWENHASWYDLGLRVDVDPTHDDVLALETPIDEPKTVFDVLEWVELRLSGQDHQFPSLADVPGMHQHQQQSLGESRRILAESITPRTSMLRRFFDKISPGCAAAERVEAMESSGFTSGIIASLPEALLTQLQDAIALCQRHPPPSWSKTMLELVDRGDIAVVLDAAGGPPPIRKATSMVIHPTVVFVRIKSLPSRAPFLALYVLSDTVEFRLISPQDPSHVASQDYQRICESVNSNVAAQGWEEGEDAEHQMVVEALFREDQRMWDAQAMLSCFKPRVVQLNHEPDWTESEYLEKQKELVATMAISTLATPAGRGMFTYGRRFPLLTQKFIVHGFNLMCTVKPFNVSVGVDKSAYTEEKVNWAFFHQGVAYGLTISPNAKGIDTSWIIYNKPGNDLNNRHAGFLLALGLNGHLKDIAKWVAFKYLTPKHTMTSIGLLLGLAVSYIGTMDSLITRLLSVHVTRMLPRGAAELNLSHHTQTTGIMGIGILYCGSQHRRMSDIMLSEIEFTEDEDEENPLRNEGYRLAAGFALGLINLGKGSERKGQDDMRMREVLLAIATTTKRVELVNVLDRSAAGAVMAIALMFMKSEDQITARKVNVPESVIQFDYVRPDILLLRTVARNLILWSEIYPAKDWIKKSLPAEYRSRYKLNDVSEIHSRDLPFLSILAGLCFSIGLRFAGSANIDVRNLLVHYLDQLMRIVRHPAHSFDSQMARANARMCMDTVALSCASVMAGTGDLVVLRRLRALHGRQDPHTPYGSHLAAHLAIGTLFLGCGTATFGTSDLAVAALLIAFYPVFPATVQDNRAHLQAFRHFWVLATDHRCLVVRDVATRQPISIPLNIELKTGTTIRQKSPCLLPPLEEISSVSTDATEQGYWDLELDFERDPGLIAAFRKNQNLYLRRGPTDEGIVAASIGALGRDEADDTVASGAAAGSSKDPMEWVFGLGSLKDLTPADREAVLNRMGKPAAGTAVDVRLALESAVDGHSRDGLLNLKLLFEWARHRNGDLEGHGMADVRRPSTAKADMSTGVGRMDIDGEETGKAADRLEPVEVDNDQSAGPNDEAALLQLAASLADPTRELKDVNLLDEESARRGQPEWWIRDGVVRMLKGKVWEAELADAQDE